MKSEDEWSYGFAVYFKDTVTCIDAQGRYAFKLIQNDTSVLVKDGFELIKGIVMKKTGVGIAPAGGDFAETIARINYTALQPAPTAYEELLFKDSLTDNNLEFSEGVYASDFMSFLKKNAAQRKYGNYTLEFKGGRYEYKVAGLLLTAGLWRRAGSYILLKDETLNAYFRLMLVADNAIKTEVFPYANEGVFTLMGH